MLAVRSTGSFNRPIANLSEKKISLEPQSRVERDNFEESDRRNETRCEGQCDGAKRSDVRK